mgnify:FL=1|tara:strand:+ start:61 stop:675 length:615 start_codon:yes stop_codon:yes gene_type:complete
MSNTKILKQTPSQTAGPYLHIGCIPYQIGINSSFSKYLNNLVLSNETKGSRIEIFGKIYDGKHDVIKDALVEIWQVDSNGYYKSRVNNNSKLDPNFNNWGRTSCDLETGLWQFHTIKPGIIKLANQKILAPHIWFWVAARGINIGLFTCMYFCDEKNNNILDCNLKKINNSTNIKSLIADKVEDDKYEFNIYLQGDKETIFFDI